MAKNNKEHDHGYLPCPQWQTFAALSSGILLPVQPKISTGKHVATILLCSRSDTSCADQAAEIG